MSQLPVRADNAALPAMRGAVTPPVRVETQSIDLFTLCRSLAASGYFQDAKDEAKAVVKVLYGQELGISAVQSMMGIHVINGKPSLSANMIASLIKGSRKYDYRIKRLDNEACSLGLFENRGGEWAEIGDSDFTLEDADRAKLLTGANKHNWTNYPRNMLFARAISNGARFYCADIFGGAAVFTPDELGAVVSGDTGDVVAAPAGQVHDLRPRLSGNETTEQPASEPTPAAQGGVTVAELKNQCVALAEELTWKGELKGRYLTTVAEALPDYKERTDLERWTAIRDEMDLGARNRRRALAIWGETCRREGLDKNDDGLRRKSFFMLAEAEKGLESTSQLTVRQWQTVADKLQANLDRLGEEPGSSTGAAVAMALREELKSVIEAELVDEADPFEDEA